MNKKSLNVLLLFSLFLIAYLPTWGWMIERWFSRDSYYSHGILIPLISIYLIRQKRGVLRTMEIKPSVWGLRLFIIGVLIHLASLLFRVYFTSAFSMLFILAGFILCFYGKKILKEIAFPVVFLMFMIPLPLAVVINVSFQLKLLSAQIATALLNVMNMQAVQQGSYIKMPHATVIVEDVCSGLRSLISLMALGALLSHWMESGKVKKTVLFLSSIPIAVIANTVRVTLLAAIGETWGTKYISPLIHNLSGFLVFVVALALLGGLRKLLK